MSVELVWVTIVSVLTIVGIPMLRAALKAHKAKKNLHGIVEDSLEAALDELDKKRRKK
jgi:uncharacterized membrane protein YccF (DUF307 family)